MRGVKIRVLMVVAGLVQVMGKEGVLARRVKPVVSWNGGAVLHGRCIVGAGSDDCGHLVQADFRGACVIATAQRDDG